MSSDFRIDVAALAPIEETFISDVVISRIAVLEGAGCGYISVRKSDLTRVNSLNRLFFICMSGIGVFDLINRTILKGFM